MGNCKGKPTKYKTKHNDIDIYIDYDSLKVIKKDKEHLIKEAPPPAYIKEYNFVERGYARRFYTNMQNYITYGKFPHKNESPEWKIYFEQIKGFTSILFTNEFLSEEDIISFCSSAKEHISNFETFITFLYKFDKDLYTFNLKHNSVINNE